MLHVACCMLHVACVVCDVFHPEMVQGGGLCIRVDIAFLYFTYNANRLCCMVNIYSSFVSSQFYK